MPLKAIWKVVLSVRKDQRASREVREGVGDGRVRSTQGFIVDDERVITDTLLGYS